MSAYDHFRAREVLSSFPFQPLSVKILRKSILFTAQRKKG